MTRARTSGDAGGLRCFLALLPDAASRATLHRCGEAPADATPTPSHGVRWLDPVSLHLTLRFFAAANTAQVEYLTHMLPTVAQALPAIDARRFAIWPNRVRPRLAVLELDAPGPLQALAGACEALARKAGFDPEPRDFRAHVTLARLRPGCALATPPVPRMQVRFAALALLASDPGSTGAPYRELAGVGVPASRP